MQLNDSEWKVMHHLWELERGGVAELHAALEGETGWAYSTVKTLLERLAEKGAVKIEKARSGRIFVPAIAEEAAQKSAFRALLDRAFGGRVGSFAQALTGAGGLSARERQELADILAAEREGKPEAKGKRRG